jgi:predicted Zn-dependent protease
MRGSTMLASRRQIMSAFGGTLLVGAAATGCSENPATGRSQFVLVSDETLAGLSQAAWRDALATLPRTSDAALQTKLSRIGTKIADVSGRADDDWEFVVFDKPEVNAFVLPGGKVGFYRGLMDFAISEGEIAAVMGHEIGHVEARHAAERMSQEALVQLGVQLTAAALSEEYGRFADDIAGTLGMGVMYGVVLPYSRAQELEADELGVRLMAEAAYDPREALGFWQRMVETNKARPQMMEWLSTHPADGKRLEKLRTATSALKPG